MVGAAAVNGAEKQCSSSAGRQAIFMQRQKLKMMHESLL
jgi:hypothetical protein